jgi:aryl-alcohol dehydrogenase-like predicted oxidoreductase
LVTSTVFHLSLSTQAYAGGDAERIMGEVIADGIADGFWRRQDLVITTKVFWGRPVRGVNDVGLSRKHVIEGVLGSLQRLQLDYVDVVYAHRPDSHTPLEETVRAFDFLVNSGKAMYWGTSEWPASRITEAVALADRLGLIAPVVEQPEYSLLHRSRVELEYADLFRSPRGYGSTVYSALGLG